MKKGIFILGLLLILSGCGNTANKQEASDGTKNQDDNKGVFATIRDAINKSITLKCEYTDEDGQQMTAFIQGHQIYLETKPKSGEDPIFGIVREDKMWMWGPKSDKGLIFDFAKQKGEPAKMGEKPIHSTDDVINKLEEKKDTCKTTVSSDSKFILPANVQFIAW